MSKPTSPDQSRPGSASGPSAVPPATTVYSLSEEETTEFGRSLARALRGGELILLEGELGLGKTVLARGIAAGLGISTEDVSSPSFTLVQHYRGGRLPMHHVDLYRLEDEQDIESIGLDELVAGEGVTVVEWGEKLGSHYRRDALRIRLYDIGEGARRIELGREDDDPIARNDA